MSEELVVFGDDGAVVAYQDDVTEEIVVSALTDEEELVAQARDRVEFDFKLRDARVGEFSHAHLISRLAEALHQRIQDAKPMECYIEATVGEYDVECVTHGTRFHGDDDCPYEGQSAEQITIQMMAEEIHRLRGQL